MSVQYRWVQWNRHKRVYDLLVLAAVALWIGGFMLVGKLVFPAPGGVSDEILVMRALGTGAIVLLHVILCIGPLARLDQRFAPLLYNRRHLGVTMFFLAAGHAVIALGYYGGFGVSDPFSAVFLSASFGSLEDFPFELAGLGALFILFVMAATSHDFWLKNLGPAVWKWLHMGVYLAYALTIAHVALGAMLSERSPLYPALLVAGIVLVSSLHIIAGLRQSRVDRAAFAHSGEDAEWIDAGPLSEIRESRARIVCIPRQESVAIFRHDGKLSAISNVCAHQGGPLGEGKIVDGCVTCPWHGYQYLPHNGQSPPPYQEKISTYRLRVSAGRVELNARALPPGTAVTPMRVDGAEGPS